MKRATRSAQPGLPADFLVRFYRFWHGYMRFKGAGYLLTKLAPHTASLQRYPLRMCEGHSIELDFRDISAMYWLNRSLGDIPEEVGLLRAMQTFVTQSDTVWDVGANCGVVSYLLATTTPVHKLVFFEPNKAMFSLSSAALSPFPQVMGLNLALSNKAGEADLTVPHCHSTTATMNPETTARSGRLHRIACATGDELVATGKAPVPNIIKVDTEGHEASVLEGLRDTIGRHRPVIFFEHISLSDSQTHAMIPAYYEIYSVRSTDGTLSRGFDRTLGHNSALVPR